MYSFLHSRERRKRVVDAKESTTENPTPPPLSSLCLFSRPRKTYKKKKKKKHKRSYALRRVFVLRHDFSRIRDVWSPYSRVDDTDRYSRAPDSGHVHTSHSYSKRIMEGWSLVTRRFLRWRTNDQMLRLRHHIFLRVTFLIVPSLLACSVRDLSSDWISRTTRALTKYRELKELWLVSTQIRHSAEYMFYYLIRYYYRVILPIIFANNYRIITVLLKISRSNCVLWNVYSSR